jgi:hypothetical protein
MVVENKDAGDSLLGSVLGTWFYSSYQTGGLIDNRYANKDALGT